jgi:ubiquinone/menaquinone biosynthesis C-methylase UbiE
MNVLTDLDGLEMLELNCGTGEDALLFSDRGFNIVATDVSEEMLKITQQKVRQFSMQHRISSHFLDLETFDETIFDKKFDLIFSNFGGLNCINPESLKKLLEKIPAILNPGGRFIAVIMPKFCLWESFYFLSRFRFKRAFQRLTKKEGMAEVDGILSKVWYYKPSQIRKWSVQFKIVGVKPVGFMLPSSRLEPFYSRKKKWLKFLNNLEKKASRFKVFASMSDYYLIDLKFTG